MRAEGCFQAEAEVVQPLGQPVQQRGHAAFGAAHGQAGEALAGLQQLEARGAVQAVRLLGQVLGNLVLRLGDQLGGGRGRGRAQVGDKIGDGEVGFVTYGGDHGKAARCNGAGHALAVEGGQVLQRSAAAGEHNHVHQADGVRVPPARPQSRQAPDRPAR